MIMHKSEIIKIIGLLLFTCVLESIRYGFQYQLFKANTHSDAFWTRPLRPARERPQPKQTGPPRTTKNFTTEIAQITDKLALSENYMFDFQYLFNISKRLSIPLFNFNQFPVDMNDISFQILGSSQIPYLNRTQILHETWLHWVPDYTIWGDANITKYHMRHVNGMNTTDKDKQLKAIRYLWENEREYVMSKKWFFLVDDDTFVNVPAVLKYIQKFHYSWPLGIGYVWDNKFIPNRTYIQGNFIAFTRQAFINLAENLYTKCKRHPSGDVMLGGCYRHSHILQLHNADFYYERVRNQLDRTAILNNDIIDLFTAHHISSLSEMMKMTCLIASVYQWEHPNCVGFDITDKPMTLPLHKKMKKKKGGG